MCDGVQLELISSTAVYHQVIPFILYLLTLMSESSAVLKQVYSVLSLNRFGINFLLNVFNIFFYFDH